MTMRTSTRRATAYSPSSLAVLRKNTMSPMALGFHRPEKYLCLPTPPTTEVPNHARMHRSRQRSPSVTRFLIHATTFACRNLASFPCCKHLAPHQVMQCRGRCSTPPRSSLGMRRSPRVGRSCIVGGSREERGYEGKRAPTLSPFFPCSFPDIVGVCNSDAPPP
jgi:hypothetical protein